MLELLDYIDEFVFKPSGIKLKSVVKDPESITYFAHQFELDNYKIAFRVAKITPTKTGQFVTIWKRNDSGITVPFDISDDIDFYIIATKKDTELGLFIFPKSILLEHRILSDSRRDGKRGIRVYPPWDLTTSKQAEKTQLWQSKYFLAIEENNKLNFHLAESLFLKTL